MVELKELDEVCLPKLGESIHSATIVKWLKQVGDYVKRDEVIAEVTTDKVASEIPSPFEGLVKEILVEEGVECDVGSVICTLSREKSGPKLSPAVLRIAEEKGISLSDISKIKGSGESGRVTKKDIESWKAPTQEKIDAIPHSHIRKEIAKNMTKSVQEIPQAALIQEIDVTRISKIISKEREEGHKVTITAYLAKAICKALAKAPLLNASYSDAGIITHSEVNLGIAVDAEGDLFVPIIKECQKLNEFEIAKSIRVLASRAKAHKLESCDLHGGTITLTNFGMTGIQIGIPIVRYPESAILGAGAIENKVVVVDEDKIVIRKIMTLALSFDHRVVDGVYACRFLDQIKKTIETWPEGS